MFFGVLTEVTGTLVKHYEEVKSLGDLRLMIEDEFPEVAHYNFIVSVNREIINTDKELNDSDEIALMPPFAGG